MKALQIKEPGRIEPVQMSEPEVQPGEVLLRLSYVGFCGSDLNTWLGRNAMAQMPVIPGHEIGAVVVKAGAGCPSEQREGLTVTVNPYTSCGQCAACRRGRSNACQHNETLGVQRQGAMREFISLPWQKVIPTKGISTRDAALIEPMSVGFHAVGRGEVSDTDFVVVIGCGMVGMGAIVRSALRGATVIAVDLSEEKLSLARKAGAHFGINSKEEDVLQRVMDITGGFGADVVIEAVGSPATYQSAIDLVSFTGRVVCIGYAKSEVSFQTRLFVQKELDIRGSRNAMPEDFRAVLRFMQQGRMSMDPFVSAVVKPEQAQDAMQKWAEAPAKVFRILVRFEQHEL